MYSIVLVDISKEMKRYSDDDAKERQVGVEVKLNPRDDKEEEDDDSEPPAIDHVLKITDLLESKSSQTSFRIAI